MKQNSDPFTNSATIIGTEKAERYTNWLKSELKGAHTEEDVRSATIGFLRNLTKEVGVNVKIQNETVVISGGRIDSLFDNIIFEFKKPSYFDTPRGISEAITGRNQTGGLIEYMISRSCPDSADVDEFKRQLVSCLRNTLTKSF